jgi:hypothetical protein
MCSTALDDLDGLSDGELLEYVSALVAEQNRATARLARAVRAAENRQAAEHDGLKSMKSWLRTHGRLSGAAISGLVREGRAVEQLPAVEAAFLAGQVTADQVDAIAEIVTPANLDRAAAAGVDLGAVEQTLLEVATSQAHTKLQTAVGHCLARLDPDGREPDPTEERSVVLVQHPDGMVTGGLTLDHHGGETVMTALEAVAAASRCAGDTRTRAQRMADALVQLCATALATGSVPRLRSNPAQLLVMIDEADLVAASNDPAAAVSGIGALLSSARARRIACDSEVSRIVFGPGRVPKDLGRKQRVVSPAQRRALDARDRSCVFAGCEAPNWWCEAHHVLEWVDDGPTDLDNLGLLCERHHTKVHHGFVVERRPDGTWHTYRPDGTEILIHPPLLAAS